jgi:ABC-type transport system involved in multi-copper enzyme maturation permease subunit
VLWVTEGTAVNTLILIFVYIVTTLIMQTIGFAISRAVDYQYPTVSLMVFLMLFLAAFYIAWPIAVKVAEKFMTPDAGLHKRPNT